MALMMLRSIAQYLQQHPKLQLMASNWLCDIGYQGGCRCITYCVFQHPQLMPEYAATAFKFLLTNQEKTSFFLQQSHICITNEHLYSRFLNEIIYYYPVNHPDL